MKTDPRTRDEMATDFLDMFSPQIAKNARKSRLDRKRDEKRKARELRAARKG